MSELEGAPLLTPNRAGMLCFNRAGQILLVSALGKDCIWLFPKGHIEKGESGWEAAEREVEEEARIKSTCDWGSPIGLSCYDYKGEAVVVEWWTGLAIEQLIEPPNGDEISWGFREVKWVDWRTALDLLSFPDMRNMLRKALCLPEVDDPAVTVTDTKEVV